MDFLSLIIEIFALLSDQDFSVLGAASEENAKVSLAGKCDLIAIFIEVCKVEVWWVLFEDLGDKALELCESLGVDRLEDMNFLVVSNFEKHGK